MAEKVQSGLRSFRGGGVVLDGWGGGTVVMGGDGGGSGGRGRGGLVCGGRDFAEESKMRL